MHEEQGKGSAADTGKKGQNRLAAKLHIMLPAKTN
jgi:hypothetical protein